MFKVDVYPVISSTTIVAVCSLLPFQDPSQQLFLDTVPVFQLPRVTVLDFAEVKEAALLCSMSFILLAQLAWTSSLSLQHLYGCQTVIMKLLSFRPHANSASFVQLSKLPNSTSSRGKKSSFVVICFYDLATSLEIVACSGRDVLLVMSGGWR